MSTFKVIALPTEFANVVRATHQGPHYAHPAHTSVATGYGPCRHCLRTFKVGQEQRTLCTYDPFRGLEEVPLPGPVFIHSAGCLRYREDSGYPEDLRKHAAVLVAYSRGGNVLEQIHVTDGTQEDAIQRLLERPDVDYLHVRDREAGCYDFRVERANGSPLVDTTQENAAT